MPDSQICDLPDALLENIFRHLNSTDLRLGACLACRQWLRVTRNAPVWEDLVIDIAREVHRPFGTCRNDKRGKGEYVPPSPRHAITASVPGLGCSGRAARGSAACAGPSLLRQPPRQAFLCKSRVAQWLQEGGRAPQFQSLRLANAEARATALGHRSTARHDLEPSDLEALLASLPSLTALHLDAAPSLLPCVSSLVPLASRLQRLCITRSYHRLDTPEGAADAASLSSLSLLTHLELSLDPPTADGLSRIPDAWSSLSTLSSLSLVGHRRLKRLPRWLPGSLKRLEVVVLEACGFKAMPAEALGPLPLLRVLSLSRSPLGEGEAAVALDAWWPPGGGGKAGGAWSEEGGSSGDGGGGALQGPAGGGSGQEEGGTPVTEAGSFFPVNAGVQAGLSGLEVLRLADCGILALPYAVTQLTRLRELDLSGNPLGGEGLGARGAGPGGGGTLRASVLRYLHESGDRGFELLEQHCTLLGTLGLQRCGLTALPPAVARLPNLTSLDLSHNPQLQLDPGQMADLISHAGRRSAGGLRLLRLAGTQAAYWLGAAE